MKKEKKTTDYKIPAFHQYSNLTLNRDTKGKNVRYQKLIHFNANHHQRFNVNLLIQLTENIRQGTGEVFHLSLNSIKLNRYQLRTSLRRS